MRIFIVTYGSRGDVQPYVALGKGLQDAGHSVTLATSERYRNFVETHGLHYGYMNDDMLAILDTDQGRDLLENTNSLFAAIRRAFSMMKQVGPMQQSLFRDGWDAAKAANPELIIFHPKAYGGAGTTAAALRAGRPSVVVPFFGDQPYWARRIHALGAGSRPFSRKTLTAGKLGSAIQTVIANPVVRRKAEALGEMIHNEQGIGNAVSMIEATMRNAQDRRLSR